MFGVVAQAQLFRCLIQLPVAKSAQALARDLMGWMAVGCAILEWVDRFNNRRPPQSIGGIPPAEAEARHHAQIEHDAMAA